MGGGERMSEHKVTITINDEEISAVVPARLNLVDFVRVEAGLTGSHVGCAQ